MKARALVYRVCGVLVSLVVPAALASQSSGNKARADQCLNSQALKIELLDVGQGDAAIIRILQKVVVIDGGPSRYQLVRTLTSQRIDTVTLMIASHNHADHIGGLQEVVERKTVLRYMENMLPATTSTYRNLTSSLQRRNVVVLHPSQRIISVGDAQLTILAPSHVDSTQNNNSIGVRIAFGKFTIVFTGDAELPEINYWLSRRLIRQSSVIKVSHHGSTNGISSRLLKSVRPKIAVVSVGRRNRFDHPSSRTLRILKSSGAKLYRTDTMGTVKICASKQGDVTVRPQFAKGLNREVK